MWRVALIGAGRRAQAHVAALEVLRDRFQPVAVCAPDLTAAGAAATRLGCRPYCDLRACLAGERVEVAVVVTSEPTHHALAAFLAGRGVHVLCETPIALTVPLADLMIEAARRAGTHLIVAENVVHEGWVQLWQRVVESGVLGRPLRVHCQALQGAYHAACLMRRLAGGAPRRVRALVREDLVETGAGGGGAGEGSRRERWLHGLLEHEGGALSVHEHGTLAQEELLGRRHLWRLQVDGTRGTLANDHLFLAGGVVHRVERGLDQAGALEALGLSLEPRLEWRRPAGCGAADPALVALLARAAAELAGAPPAYTLEEARLDLATAVALEESAARGGMPLPLPLAHPTAHERELEASLRARVAVDLRDLDAVVATRLPRG